MDLIKLEKNILWKVNSLQLLDNQPMKSPLV